MTEVGFSSNVDNRYDTGVYARVSAARAKTMSPRDMLYTPAKKNRMDTKID